MSWRPPVVTVPAAKSAVQVAGLGRRANDPLGRGWRWVGLKATRPGNAVVRTVAIPAGKTGLRVKGPGTRVRRVKEQVEAEDAATIVPETPRQDLNAGKSADVAVSRRPDAAGSPPAGSAPAVPAAAAVTAGGRFGRRIELVPASPPLPAILFTGDVPPVVESKEVSDAGVSPASVSAVLKPAVPAHPAPDVWLHARDPHTVVAHWDRGGIAGTERKEPGRWWVRLHEEESGGAVVSELPAPEPEGTVVLPVTEPGRRYVAELGYESVRTGWHPVAVSPPESMPPVVPVVLPAPAGVSDASAVDWGHFGGGTAGSGTGSAPVEVISGGEWVSSIPAVPMRGNSGPEAEAWVEGGEGPVEWAWRWWLTGGAESSEALALMGFAEAGGAEGWRRRQGVASAGGDAGTESAGVSSSVPVAETGARSGRDFWFRVNAEVILHGSTRPDARVTVAGRRVALRPDGSFSFRFAFPDGDFRLPLVAETSDGVDRLGAQVRFLRGTSRDGEVGVHPMAGGWDAELGEWGR